MIAMYVLGVATGWGTILVLVQWERLQADRKDRRGPAYWQAMLESDRK